MGYRNCSESLKTPQNSRRQKGNLKQISLCGPTNMTRNGAELSVALVTCRPGFVHPWSYVYDSTIDVNMLMATG